MMAVEGHEGEIRDAAVLYFQFLERFRWVAVSRYGDPSVRPSSIHASIYASVGRLI